jgi:hypothetical protein
MIVDDNSNYDYIKIPNDRPLNNCFIIQSEFKGRGEILAYYYYHKYHPFETAVILHDSTFINKYIDFRSTQDVIFLWSFMHSYDNPSLESEFILRLNRTKELSRLHKNQEEWTGCFGVQSVITLSFLNRIVEKYGLFQLIPFIYSRNERYHLERIFAVVCSNELGRPIDSLFGIIHRYSWGWGYTFEQYIQDKETGNIAHLPVIKVWSGR